jgi:hypothetical protein
MAERRIHTQIDIEAPVAHVWALLSDFAGMSFWNPFIRSVSGRLKRGARLTVHVAPPGKSGMRFRPVVLAVRPERELRWRGRLLLPGIFTGEHYFLLEPLAPERTRFTQGERFSGVLVGYLARTLSDTEAGFRSMNVALKRRAETQAREQENRTENGVQHVRL